MNAEILLLGIIKIYYCQRHKKISFRIKSLQQKQQQQQKEVIYTWIIPCELYEKRHSIKQNEIVFVLLNEPKLFQFLCFHSKSNLIIRQNEIATNEFIQNMTQYTIWYKFKVRSIVKPVFFFVYFLLGFNQFELRRFFLTQCYLIVLGKFRVISYLTNKYKKYFWKFSFLENSW